MAGIKTLVPIALDPRFSVPLIHLTPYKKTGWFTNDAVNHDLDLNANESSVGMGKATQRGIKWVMICNFTEGLKRYIKSI